MFVPLQFFSAGQQAHQFLRLVDQNGKMLRADVVFLLLVLQLQQRNFLAGFLADQAAGGVFGHFSSEIGILGLEFSITRLRSAINFCRSSP